ncbi:T9SS type A sorting domain-containing protein [candidate division KSB1 bacterium]|nr:T9SS type A sorting domain-containing protein [candidate division KSB1 bacterium]
MAKSHLLIPRLESAIEINAVWEKSPWCDIDAIELTNHMGDYPDHFPRVLVKIAYDAEAIYVIYRVADRYVLAVTQEYQGSVYTDSCVEFFFTPHEDVSLGYFNLEMNCGGTALFNFQKRPRADVVQIARSDFAQIDVAHSMPRIVSPEIQDSTTWVLEYRIPYAFLTKYSTVVIPAPGVKWRANFYKCADNSSHPHWLTWSPVDYARPNFHLPDYFGVLEFGASVHVDKRREKTPHDYALSSHPNPFNQQSTIQFTLPVAAHVELTVYDIHGQEVAILLNDDVQAGRHAISWDAADLPSGVYIGKMRAGDVVRQHKFTCIR